MTRKRREPDPFHDIREWQDHRYDPGYFTGGRIHPMYRGSRPNRWGYVLMFMGGMSLLVFPWLLVSGRPALEITWMTAVSLLLFLAGLRLVRGPRRGRGAA